MKRKSRDFSFMGFVALADMIFAVSTGMLLLNPLQARDDTKSAPNLEQLAANVQSVDREIASAEQAMNELDQLFQKIIQGSQKQ